MGFCWFLFFYKEPNHLWLTRIWFHVYFEYVHVGCMCHRPLLGVLVCKWTILGENITSLVFEEVCIFIFVWRCICVIVPIFHFGEVLSHVAASSDLPPLNGHFTNETESPWPFHFKHSHWWKRRSRSKFELRTTLEGPMEYVKARWDVKSTWIPTWDRMDHVSWSLGLLSKTTSWRPA